MIFIVKLFMRWEVTIFQRVRRFNFGRGLTVIMRRGKTMMERGWIFCIRACGGITSQENITQ